jgi:hypothetical protein
VSDAERAAQAAQESGQRLQPLLTALGITRVISVDDAWAQTVGKDAAETLDAVAGSVLVDEAARSEIIRLLVAMHSDRTEGVDLDSSDAVADFIRQQWDALGEDFHQQAAQVAAVEVVDVQPADGEAEVALGPRLLDLFGEDVIAFMGLTEWRAEFANVSASETGTLVLFDRDFTEEEGGTESTGEELATALIAAGNPQIRVAMLTHLVKSEDEELRSTRDFEQTHAIEAGLFVAVGKYRLRSPEGVGAAISAMLLASEIEEYRKLVASSLAGAAIAAADELDALHRYTIMGSISSARREGTFELEAPLRLIESAYRRALYRGVRDEAIAPDLLTKFRSTEGDDYRSLVVPGAQIVDVLNADRFESPEFVVGLHLPIEVGDIFESRSPYPTPGKAQVPNPRLWLLLGQACDISVRPNGRRMPEIYTFVLHELRPMPTSTDPRVVALSARVHPIGLLDPRSPVTWGVNLGSKLLAPAAAVDATVFTDDGAATIDTATPPSTHLMPESWSARHEELQRLAVRALKDYESAEKLVNTGADGGTLLRRIGAAILNASIDTKVGVGAVLDPTAKRVQFGLRRVGRVLPRAATGLVTLAANYDGRPAFDAPVAEYPAE